MRVIVLPDYHSIMCDRVTMAAVERYMRDGQFERGVQLGDFLNFDSISSHSVGNLRAISASTIREEYDFCNRTLDRWQKLVPKWDLIEGNHDFRIESWLDAHPQARGCLEVPNGLDLERRGVNWVPFWSKGTVLRIGKAGFIHGLYTNEFHAKKHVQRYGMNIFYGHVHDIQSYSHTLMGDDSTLIGQSLGCLCRPDLDYIRGKPTNWRQAIAEFHFWPNGDFQYYIIQIFNHRFIAPSGERYDGRKLLSQTPMKPRKSQKEA